MPDDNNTIPLINTIRETTIAAIAKKYKIETAQKRFDISHSQSDSEYITGEIGEYNDTIQDIIDNIPDVPPTPPGPTLPTVDTSNSNWLTTSTGRNVTINAGSVIDAYDWTSESGYFRPEYDTSKTYAVRAWYDETPTLIGNSGLSIINQNNYICIQNQLSTSTNFAQGYYATCSSSQAEVITVYDSSNNAFNAFKYAKDNVDYYYVLDGTQNDWTDDLSSIGYSLTKNLPIVQNVQCWFNQNQGSASVAASFTRLVYDANNSRIPYSSSLLYCVFLLSATETLDGTFEVVQSTNDNIAISRSNGTNSTTVYSVFYASCSDKTATIIDVYDSQNKAFKAFKYTLDGVDYYRVMEWQNTHPDWVTDLSSIGYYLPIVGYANQQKTQTFVNNDSSPETPLFDENGKYLTYDATKQNIIVGFWTSADGSKQSTPSGFYIYHNTQQTIYTFFYYKSGGSGTYFQRVEFILVPK